MTADGSQQIVHVKRLGQYLLGPCIPGGSNEGVGTDGFRLQGEWSETAAAGMAMTRTRGCPVRRRRINSNPFTLGMMMSVTTTSNSLCIDFPPTPLARYWR